MFSDYPNIFSDGVYYGERETSPYGTAELDGALITSFVRESVAKRLLEASKKLPPYHAFMTLDTLRTEAVQKSLFDHFKNKLTVSPFNYSEELAVEKTQTYVTQPSRTNSPHLTGGAVDLTIVRFEPQAWDVLQGLNKQLSALSSDPSLWEQVYEVELHRQKLLRTNSRMLDMGVAYDEVSADEKGEPQTALHYYEDKLKKEGRLSEEETVILKNRRMLYHILVSVGFTLYPDEPWHADYGNKFWAQQSGSSAALFGYAELSSENWAHEKMRRAVHAGNVALSSQKTVPVNGKVTSPLLHFVHAMAQMFGSPAYMGRTLERYERAHRISPDGLVA